MKTNWFHILAALANRDLHGLAIVRNVLEQTGGRVKLWPTSLYGSLETMASKRLIRELAADEIADEASAQRRYYRITDEGRQALRAEAERLAGMASTALQRLEEA